MKLRLIQRQSNFNPCQACLFHKAKIIPFYYTCPLSQEFFFSTETRLTLDELDAKIFIVLKKWVPSIRDKTLGGGRSGFQTGVWEGRIPQGSALSSALSRLFME